MITIGPVHWRHWTEAVPQYFNGGVITNYWGIGANVGGCTGYANGVLCYLPWKFDLLAPDFVVCKVDNDCFVCGLWNFYSPNRIY